MKRTANTALRPPRELGVNCTTGCPRKGRDSGGTEFSRDCKIQSDNPRTYRTRQAAPAGFFGYIGRHFDTTKFAGQRWGTASLSGTWASARKVGHSVESDYDKYASPIDTCMGDYHPGSAMRQQKTRCIEHAGIGRGKVRRGH